MAGLLALAIFGCASTGAPPDAADREKQRAALLEYEQQTLEKLYDSNPAARAEIAAASGHAVFNLTSVNAVLLVGQQGKGVLVDHGKKTTTFMKTSRAGTGPGIGYQELRQVFVFTSTGALEQFVAGKSLGGDVSASYSIGKENAQQSLNPNIKVYQINESGYALQANWGGTAYFVDADLN